MTTKNRENNAGTTDYTLVEQLLNRAEVERKLRATAEERRHAVLDLDGETITVDLNRLIRAEQSINYTDTPLVGYVNIANWALEALRLRKGIYKGVYCPLELSEITTPELQIALAYRVTKAYINRLYSDTGAQSTVRYLYSDTLDDLIGIVLLAWGDTYGINGNLYQLDENAAKVGGRALSQYINRAYHSDGVTLSDRGETHTVKNKAETSADGLSERSYKAVIREYYKAVDECQKMGETDYSFIFEYRPFFNKMLRILGYLAKKDKRRDNCLQAFKLYTEHGKSLSEISTALNVDFKTVKQYRDTWKKVAKSIAPDFNAIYINNINTDSEQKIKEIAQMFDVYEY